MGERWYGAGQRIDTFFYLFFGSGLGGRVVLNGRPYGGFTGNAGEIGYLPLTLADTGRGEASHVGQHFNLPLLYAALRGDGLDVRTPADLDALLVSGHPCLLGWMDTAADHLTGLVLAVEYLLDPQAIFCGGRFPDGILLRGFLDRVAQRAPGRRMVGKATAPHYRLATAGADAPALGVATLPMYELFAPAPQVLLKQGRGRATGGLPSRMIVGV